MSDSDATDMVVPEPEPELPITATVAEALDLLAGAAGVLTVDAVVDAARLASSPLHRYFTWDDSVAAAQFRRLQAGNLIRRVRVTRLVVDEQGPRQLRPRRWVVPAAEPGVDPGTYRRVEDVLAGERGSAELVARFRREADAFVARWRDLAAFADWLREEAARVDKAA